MRQRSEIGETALQLFSRGRTRNLRNGYMPVRDQRWRETGTEETAEEGTDLAQS